MSAPSNFIRAAAIAALVGPEITAVTSGTIICEDARVPAANRFACEADEEVSFEFSAGDSFVYDRNAMRWRRVRP